MNDAEVRPWTPPHVRDTTPEPTSEFIAFWVWLAVIAVVIFGAGVGTGWALWG